MSSEYSFFRSGTLLFVLLGLVLPVAAHGQVQELALDTVVNASPREGETLRYKVALSTPQRGLRVGVSGTASVDVTLRDFATNNVVKAASNGRLHTL